MGVSKCSHAPKLLWLVGYLSVIATLFWTFMPVTLRWHLGFNEIGRFRSLLETEDCAFFKRSREGWNIIGRFSTSGLARTIVCCVVLVSWSLIVQCSCKIIFHVRVLIWFPLSKCAVFVFLGSSDSARNDKAELQVTIDLVIPNNSLAIVNWWNLYVRVTSKLASSWWFLVLNSILWHSTSSPLRCTYQIRLLLI